jgi:hypothetical protein
MQIMGVDGVGIGLAIASAYIRPKGTASDLPKVKDAAAELRRQKHPDAQRITGLIRYP